MSIDRVQELEAQLADLEEQGASQNSAQEKPSWALSIEETNAWRRERGLSPLEPVTTLEHLRSSSEQSTVTTTPIPGPVSYTDQELLETKDQGPDCPGCDAIRARAARNLPNWMELGFISAFGCLTPVEERIRKLENQSMYPPRNGP
jgi:hypothetical protein